MLNREEEPVANVYSTYEAKARFSEVMRKVRAGQRVVIAYRGEEVAEIRPLENRGGSLAKTMAQLEDQGVLGRSAKPAAPLRRLARKPGALKRFLESRE
jgi:prevent-host-death family protein